MDIVRYIPYSNIYIYIYIYYVMLTNKSLMNVDLQTYYMLIVTIMFDDMGIPGSGLGI